MAYKTQRMPLYSNSDYIFPFSYLLFTQTDINFNITPLASHRLNKHATFYSDAVHRVKGQWHEVSFVTSP